MELRARTRTLPRHAATTAAALAVLLASALAGAFASPADAKTSKPPVVTKISPMTVSVGQTLTMRGRGFLRGRNKTTVVFRRDGARAVFVKADLSTAKLLKATVPDTLSKYFRQRGDQAVDKVEDGYEYESALNLNDDEFQEPNTDLFYPAKLPYPNPLYADDANTDFDGDSLTLSEEQALWKYTYEVGHTDARTLTPLSYSDGRQRSESINADGYAKHVAFVSWLDGSGYRRVVLKNRGWTSPVALPQGSGLYGIFDADRDGESADEVAASFDRDGDHRLSDDERDEDADGLSNYDELHGRMLPSYWTACYSTEPAFHIAYAGTDVVDADSDGDGVLDGADDQDHDDVPNIMELSRVAADGGSSDSVGNLACNPPSPLPRDDRDYGRVNPFNPCLPDRNSRTCPLYYNGSTGAPFYTDGDRWAALQ